MLYPLHFSGLFFRYPVSAGLVFLVPVLLLLLLLLLVLVLVPAPSAGVLPIRPRRPFVVAQYGFRTGTIYRERRTKRLSTARTTRMRMIS